MPEDPYYKSKEHKVWVAAVFAMAPHDGQGRALCVNCLRYGRRTPATVAHHIKPRSLYPELALDPANGAALCGRCHNREHPEKGGKRRHPPLFYRRFE